MAAAVVASPDGTKVFVTGASRGGEIGYEYATVAYDAASGSQLWVTRYNGTGISRYHEDQATAIGVSSDGSTVFVTGYSAGFVSNFDYATVAYDAENGTQLWVARYTGGTWNDYAQSLFVSPDDSSVFVTGYSTGPDGDFDYATVAYNASTGAQLWVARYDGPAEGDDRPTSLAASANSNAVFVTGSSTGLDAKSDYATVALSAETGTQLWVARFNGPTSSYDGATALAVSPNGSLVFVTGYSLTRVLGDDGLGGQMNHLIGNSDYATLAYDAMSGSVAWTARFNRGPGLTSDAATSLAASPDGLTVFVAGWSSAGLIGEDVAGDFDAVTVAYSATMGAQLWEARSNGFDARIITVSPDGAAVFVTGSSRSEYSTTAYGSRTGRQQWVARYRDPGTKYHYARSFAVSPDGSAIFVTGYSDTGGYGIANDYVTVAFWSGCVEQGVFSSLVHSDGEPLAGAASPFVHGVNCDLVAASDL